MWVIIGQITWLHANYRHLDRFWPFLGHSGPQIPNLGVPFLANFFSSKYRHVGCPERCHVMPGLSATFSNGRDPLRGSKRRKSHFYGHYGPQIPIFGTSFSANFFFSSKYGHVGCPERCHVIPGLSATFSNTRDPLRGSKRPKSNAMWCLVLMQPFQTQGNPLRGLKRPKSQFYGHFGPLIPIFWLFWVGCLAFEKVA